MGAVGIPVFHTAVNLLACCIWLPGSGALVALAKKTLPYDEKEKEEMANRLTMLDKNLLDNPGFALKQADKAVMMLADTASEALKVFVGFQENPDFEEQIERLCNRIGQYETQIGEYLIQISTRTTDRKNVAYVGLLNNAATAFLQIGKIAERIMELGHEYLDKLGDRRDMLTDEDRKEMKVIQVACGELLSLTITDFEERTYSISYTVQFYREEISNISGIVRQRHIRALHGNKGRPELRAVINDITYLEEHLVDQCDMISDAVIHYLNAMGKTVQMDDAEIEAKRQKVKEIFADKYELLDIR